jgi:hypothetical protein
MALHFFVEFPDGYDWRIMDGVLRSTGLPIEIHPYPRLIEEEPDSLAISLLTRSDPTALLEALVHFFREIEPLPDSSLVEPPTDRRVQTQHRD